MASSDSQETRITRVMSFRYNRAKLDIDMDKKVNKTHAQTHSPTKYKLNAEFIFIC